MKKYRSKWRAEDKAPGIAPNHTEIDEALNDLIEKFDKAGAAAQKATAEIKSKVEEKLVQAQNMRNSHLKRLARPGKGKKMIQVNVRKKDLVGQHPMILFHIFLKSMKGKFHCVKKNLNLKKNKSLI